MALKRLEAVERSYRRAFYRAVYRNAPVSQLVERWEDLERAVTENWKKKVEYIDAYMKAKGLQV